MTRFATTVTLVLALTGSTVGAALAARTDAPALQRAADRIAAASHPSRSIEHATPQSAKARARRSRVSGVCSAGLITLVQPAQRAGAIFQAAISSG